MNQHVGPFAPPRTWMVQPMVGIVVSVQDPASMGRVQVKLPALDAEAAAPIWARVAVPFAGDKFGAFFIPDVDTEVLVVFMGGDPAWPVVVGNLWNGKTELPESIGQSVDRWTLTGKAGTRIAIVEEAPGNETVEIETPSGVNATLTDEAGGSITLRTSTNTITMDSKGVTIQTSGRFTVQANSVSISAGTVDVKAGISSFNNVVKTDAITANSIMGKLYTPGTGNVW